MTATVPAHLSAEDVVKNRRGCPCRLVLRAFASRAEYHASHSPDGARQADWGHWPASRAVSVPLDCGGNDNLASYDEWVTGTLRKRASEHATKRQFGRFSSLEGQSQKLI